MAPGTAGLTPAEASLRGRLGAYTLHAHHDGHAITAKARAAFLSRFEVEVDPGNLLPPEERRRRAEHARKAYFARLALLSARARRQKKKSPQSRSPPPE